jgi:hypothetical protein
MYVSSYEDEVLRIFWIWEVRQVLYLYETSAEFVMYVSSY